MDLVKELRSLKAGDNWVLIERAADEIERLLEIIDKAKRDEAYRMNYARAALTGTANR